MLGKITPYYLLFAFGVLMLSVKAQAVTHPNIFLNSSEIQAIKEKVASGQKLTVKWTVQTSHDSAGNGTVGWQAVTLQ